MAYRHLEDSWLNDRDSHDRQVYFRTAPDIRGAVSRYFGNGGTLVWDVDRLEEAF